MLTRLRALLGRSRFSGVQDLKIKPNGGRGQISVALILVMTVILGAIGLGADMALLYFNWVILQKGVDAAALAGAGYLQSSDSSATTTAVNVAITYAREQWHQERGIDRGRGRQCGLRPGSLHSITVTARRTVPYAFFKLIGLSNWHSGRQRDRPDAAGARLRELHQRGVYAGQPAHRHSRKHLQYGRSM